MKTKQLSIAPDLALPLDFITETAAIIAQRRAGKTYTASVLAEEMIAASLPFVVLDPTGAWWGLRASADGKGAGLPVVIVGGAHGDVPLEAGAGKIIADLVIDHPGWYILDLSGGLEEDEMHQFALDFARRLFVRKQKTRDPLHIFVDEADEFAKQKPMSKLDHALLRAYDRLCRRGGLYGIGMTFITQRPQVFNKDLLSQIGTLFVLRLVSPQDQDAIAGWVQHGVPKDLRDAFMNSLSSLGKGDAWMLSPGYLEKFVRAQIRERRTFNSSATPKAGERALVPQRLAEIDLQMLGAEIAATIERANESDPEMLRARLDQMEQAHRTREWELEQQVRRLEREAGSPKVMATPPVVKEIYVFRDGEVVALQALRDAEAQSLQEYQAAMAQADDAANRLHALGDKLAQHLGARIAQVEAMDALVVRATLLQEAPSPVMEAATAPAPTDKITARDLESAGAESGIFQKEPDALHLAKHKLVTALSSGERKILNVLAQYPHGRTKVQVAVLTRYARKGGGFGNLLSGLRTHEFIVGKDHLKITNAGRAVLGQVTPLPAGKALLEYWLKHPAIGKAERLILTALWNARPHGMRKEKLAEATGYAHKGGGFGNALGKLRTLELIVREGEVVRINGEVFE